MRDVKAEADETQMRLRAMAVASGLMTESQAEEWIVVKAGKFGKGAFKGVDAPPTCPGCGHDHEEDWVPLEIGVSRDMPEATRNAFVQLVQHTGGAVN
jgi:hypothetical protein